MYDAATLPADSYGYGYAYGQVSDYDYDYYAYTVQATGTLYVDLYHYDTSYADIDITLYDSYGNYLDSSSGTDYYEEMSVYAYAGETLYIAVNSYYGTDDYSLYTTEYADSTSSSASDDYVYDASGYSYSSGEAGDSIYDATYLPDFGTVIGSVSDSDIYDYFAITVAETGDVLVDLYHYDTYSADIDITLYDANGNYLDSSSGTSGYEYMSTYAYEGDTLYVEVESYSGADDYYLYIA